MRTVEKYILEWNSQNETLFYIPKVIPGKTDTIVIRFAPENRPTKIKDPWNKLVIGVETKSRGVLSVSTNETMYDWGVIELKIISNPQTKAENIIKTLEWIGKSFLK